MHLPILLEQVRACAACSDSLPLGPRPLIQISRTAGLLVVGQAPGRLAHESGIPWNDRSGERLREWLSIDKTVFYDPSRVALMPMGFCFPGTGSSGDLSPKAKCAPLWHALLLGQMTDVKLTVLVGNHAFAKYLGEDFETLTDAVRAGSKLLPGRIAIPHPSPRNNIWLKKNPWFAESILPALQARVREILKIG